MGAAYINVYGEAICVQKNGWILWKTGSGGRENTSFTIYYWWPHEKRASIPRKPLETSSLYTFISPVLELSFSSDRSNVVDMITSNGNRFLSFLMESAAWEPRMEHKFKRESKRSPEGDLESKIHLVLFGNWTKEKKQPTIHYFTSSWGRKTVFFVANTHTQMIW